MARRRLAMKHLSNDWSPCLICGMPNAGPLRHTLARTRLCALRDRRRVRPLVRALKAEIRARELLLIRQALPTSILGKKAGN